MADKDLFGVEVLKRLNIIINLLLNQAGNPENQMRIGERIKYLKSMGLPEVEIGKIVGKPTNYVHAVLSQEKKREKERKE